MRRLLLLLLLLLPLSSAFAGQAVQPSTLTRDELKEVGIVQRLGETIPAGLAFTESDGSRVDFDTLLSQKPTLLVPVYYECPNLCTVVLNALVQSLADLRRTAGDGFQVVAVSIDPCETPRLAAMKKESYFRLYGRGAPDAWHFLTGDGDAVRRLTDAVGYRYRYDASSGQFAHGSGVIVVGPRRTIAQYLLGIEFQPQQIEAALRVAREGRTGSPVHDLLLLCYRYNPLVGPHGVAIAWTLKAAAFLSVTALGGYIGRQLYRERHA
jgi:protein SCO1